MYDAYVRSRRPRTPEAKLNEPRARGASGPSFLHHVAIETANLDNCAAWYREFLGFERTWTLTQFSRVTESRLPGIVRLSEIAWGPIRLHVFERAHSVPARRDSVSVLQHLCLAMPSVQELEASRSRWLTLFHSGRFTYVRQDEPTQLETDDAGVVSFYAYDVDGLELELQFDASTRA